MLCTIRVIRTLRANDNDALIPEMWAMEGLDILTNNMVMGNLVHHDYSDEIARKGDVVNTRLPSTFTAYRKSTPSADVTLEDATMVNIPVRLNQLLYKSFMIYDGEESMAFKSLVTTHLRPAVISLAQRIDQILCYQYGAFLGSGVGGADLMTSSNATDYILAAREKLNTNMVPNEGRNLIWNTADETTALKTELFVSAEKRGDNGTALRNASLGYVLGFDHYLDQNMPNIATGSSTGAGTVNLAAGYAAGTLTIATTGANLSAAKGAVAGAWVTIAGEMVPHRISSVNADPATSIVLETALTTSVAHGAAVTVYTPGAINMSGGYALNYDDTTIVDAFSVAPKVGQALFVGTTDYSYCAGNWSAAPTTTLIETDRPYEVAVADNDKLFPVPAGGYNLAFHRDAISLVSRPLATPQPGTGARSAVMNYNGIALRVTITYNGSKQGHLVTVDLLCGVKVLDENRGAVLVA